MANAKIFPPMSEREIRGAAISRHAASEGMVLLKNRSAALPLAAGQAIQKLGGKLVQQASYRLPGTEIDHQVVVVEKVGHTPSGYPRRYAKIESAPL